MKKRKICRRVHKLPVMERVERLPVAPANLPKHASGQPSETSGENGVETQVLIKNEAAWAEERLDKRRMSTTSGTRWTGEMGHGNGCGNPGGNYGGVGKLTESVEESLSESSSFGLPLLGAYNFFLAGGCVDLRLSVGCVGVVVYMRI